MTTGIFVILLSVMLKIHKRPGYDLCTLELTQLDCIESRVEVSGVSFVNFIDILEVRKKNAKKK